MKISKRCKNFWTLNRHHAEGFTLVELIVVIAILAILAGVAVPAYSGYVEEANKQADISLASEVAKALELAYYNQMLPEGAVVVLTKTGVDAENLTEEAKDAIEAAFGSVSSVAGLKYDGWNGNYSGGSYAGKETSLLGEVEGLTEALAGFLETNAESGVLGGRFGNYMRTELGFSDNDLEDEGKVADAAVLYVANTTKKLTSDQQKALAKVGEGAENNPMQLFQNVLDDVYPGDGKGNPQNVFAATATTYAIMAGYFSSIGEEMPAIDITAVSSGEASEMMTMLSDTFGPHFNNEENMANWKNYLETQAAKDAAAFVDVMGTADSSKGQIVGTLGEAGCYTSDALKQMFTNYGVGNVIVILDVSNGIPQVVYAPEMN